MSEIVRLTLVSHAMTDAMAAGRFPRDEALNALGRRQVDTSVDLGVVDAAVCAPETRTRQTAERLGLRAETEPLLADVNCGAWRGSELGGVDAGELTVWLTDPTRAPHGGESVADLVTRVGGWLESLSDRRGRLVAVTHPGVVRAAVIYALSAPPASFWRVDVGPVCRTVMHLRGGSWTLRSTG
ncbi:histidine phosphatase family protein [Mycobacterium sp. NPDC006124]|uniref:histidine phosphatase family protein n=1 Tax=Mycobacterium sp. NPDC006124 TaxID=3156729 RepID=UPI0033B40F0E